MLLQSWNGVIRVCPALPKTWDATFKLLAIGGFEVTAQAQHGHVEWLSVKSLRGGTLRLVNPFAGQVIIRCGQLPVKNLATEAGQIAFPTQAGDTYTLRDAHTPNTPGSDRRRSRRTWSRNILPSDSQRSIGKPSASMSDWQAPREPHAPQPPTPVAAIERAARPAVHPTRFTIPPRLDGALTDAVWQSAEVLGSFFKLGTATPAAQQTEARVGYDAQTCTWASPAGRCTCRRCKRSASRSTTTSRSFRMDSIEVYLQQPGGGACWHFAVNALGACYDALAKGVNDDDVRFNPLWKAAGVRHGNR